MALQKSFNSFDASKKSSVQKMNLITINEGVMMNDHSSELDDVIHEKQVGKKFPK